MSRTIKYDPYEHLRKPKAKPSYVIDSGKYNKKKIRQQEKKVIEQQLEEINNANNME